MKNIIIIMALFLGACHSESSTSSTSVVAETEETVLLVADFMKEHSNVTIGAISTKSIAQTIESTGVLVVPSSEQYSIHSKSGGSIQEIAYRSGDYVKKGAKLFVLSNPDLIPTQRILLETKAALKLAQKVFAREAILEKDAATTQKELDESLAQKELLEAKYKGLKAELQLIGVDIASLENSYNFQSKITIRAPHSGFVTNVLVQKGSLISPEDQLTTIVAKDKMSLELNVLSKYIPLLTKGQRVLVEVPNSTDSFKASVERLSSVVDQRNGTLVVYCQLDTKDLQALKPGMFVNGLIKVNHREVEGLPNDAVVKEGAEYFAYFVEGNVLVKTLLKDVLSSDGFITFSNKTPQQMVVKGAYYVE
ncbi:MAG: Probable Co/Zn/Cd efflux system membrane fusion protein [uncultured Aureispira sp.]|uniref:Probable Co/Zn/Cd efflux system membrane fusion protein n=1 Tax=uncultured Aureispira sp. TaxID=1331704 RepID=A0A6S6UF60_9BACT|nr:MAG: Probable Co/Zn/Cd efflux system membrane fusion protein [uncultured Aureispira sp.]